MKMAPVWVFVLEIAMFAKIYLAFINGSATLLTNPLFNYPDLEPPTKTE